MKDDLYTNSLIAILRYLTALKSRLDNKTMNIDKNNNVNSENFCWVLFFKKADRIAITKSSLLEAIIFNTQTA